jgi:hypothetical protein
VPYCKLAAKARCKAKKLAMLPVVEPEGVGRGVLESSFDSRELMKIHKSKHDKIHIYISAYMKTYLK